MIDMHKVYIKVAGDLAVQTSNLSKEPGMLGLSCWKVMDISVKILNRETKTKEIAKEILRHRRNISIEDMADSITNILLYKVKCELGVDGNE